MGRACPDCGSPARGNPCWYSIKHPGYAASGGDPPCIDYDYEERRARPSSRRRFAAIMFLTAAAVLTIAWLTS